ncbi:MAG: hypothetical protein U0974_00320 [Gemmatimonadales bacterium]|nr:hypothetical protein [Gemmatimonadales bacterium]MDZ4388164.1 hypothetical protein [Gemmatimonadales bacterium]
MSGNAVTRAGRLAAALLLGTLACSGDEPPTLPPQPAEPTGTFLLYDPSGILFTLAAGTETPLEISRLGSRFIEIGTSLLPGGTSVVGMGVARNGIPRGLRRLDLAEGGELTILAELDVDAWTFAERGSPDGKVLAFIGNNMVPGLLILMQMDLATLDVEQLWTAAGTEDEREFSRFRWLPDRSALIGQLWGLDRSAPIDQPLAINRFRLARFDMATRTMTTFSDWMLADMVTPTMEVSRDGRIIVYNGQDGILRFVTLDGTPAPGFPTDLRGLFPNFSPDGKLLAYSKLRDGIAGIDGVFIYRFSDGATWRLLPEGSRLTNLLDWE